METGAEPGENEVTDLDAKKGGDLIYAARNGDIETVKSLLGDSVPIGFRDGSGWTALKWAASEGHEDVLALLLDFGAAEDEVGAAEADGTSGGGSALHWAAYKGHVRLVWRLLTCKPKLSARALDAESNTPLHLAAAGGHLLVLKTMLSEGVDVSLKNAYGNSASQLSTFTNIQALLKEAHSAALDGRPYLCSCSGEFCSEAKSTADAVIDRVSAPNLRPVRYSSTCAQQIRMAEDALTHAIRAADVPRLQEAIEKAEKIGASLPMIEDAITSLERLQAQIALGEAVEELQGLRPLKERALLRPINAPLKQARDTGVAAAILADADSLIATVDAEVYLLETIAACTPHRMPDAEEPPSAESDAAKRAEAAIAKLAAAIAQAQAVEAFLEVIEQAETELAFLTAESELRKSLLLPKEGTAEDGTPYWTQHNGQRVYSALEDLQVCVGGREGRARALSSPPSPSLPSLRATNLLSHLSSRPSCALFYCRGQFRNDFLDASIEKAMTAGTQPQIMAFAAKAQKELKVKLKDAQIEDEDRKAKEAAAAAKAAKKKKGKK